MSHSYRKTPITGHGGGSEKEDKRIYNRRLRSAVRQKLRTCSDFDTVMLPLVRDVSNPWSMNKDGKSYDDLLASLRKTLREETRHRDGRTRKLLMVTEDTLVFVHWRNNRMALHYSWPTEDAWWQNYIASKDVEFYLSGLRK